MRTELKVDITFDQILSIVRKLPVQQKIKLSRELEKDTIDKKLTQLLKTFKTDELDLKTIDQEVEAVRQEIYDKQQR
ncbi:MAG: hypothetical protein J0H55_16275 [Chitinophagaceae bacterium]|nr:hypothetical protein [Chitinophagaceae bacterium]